MSIDIHYDDTGVYVFCHECDLTLPVEPATAEQARKVGQQHQAEVHGSDSGEAPGG